MQNLRADYKKCVEQSERVAWRLDDVFPRGATLDFSRPFMPSAMVPGGQLAFLDGGERRKLNQIFGNAYRHIFYFVEAYIVEMAMRHAQAELYGDEHNLRAMLRFAEEEVKHQQMFLRFGEMFDGGFGSPCALLESPQEVAEVIVRKRPIAVVLVTLHLELVTQTHYTDCIRDQRDIEPLFQRLFKYHWIEEAQHARLDALELLRLLPVAREADVRGAVADYFDVLSAFEELLGEQARHDVQSLEAASGRTLSASERGAVETAQRKAYLGVFLRDGLTSAPFLQFLREHLPFALEPAARFAERLA